VAVRIALALFLVLAACGSEPGVSTTAGSPTEAPVPGEAAPAGTTTGHPVEAPVEGCANVVGVVVRSQGGTFAFDVSVASTETGWDKYADAWEVRAEDGTVLGERVLTHPHETEQPFTRSLSAVEIPPEVLRVTIAARDSVLGYCGDSMTIDLPDPS
jgi:hypothetical protein